MADIVVRKSFPDTLRLVFGPSMRRNQAAKFTVVYILLFGFLVVAIVPLIWVLSTSFKTSDQLRISYPIQWIPNPVYYQNYLNGWAAEPWLLYLRNTLIYAVGSTIGLLVSTIPVSYAFARMKFPGRDVLMFINISLMLLPGQVTMVPVFVLFSWLGWIGSFKPVIVPWFFAVSAWEVFVLRQFFRSIPTELSDAALIDGANDFDIMTKIILPLSKPAIAVITVLQITFVWNDFLTSTIYLRDSQHMPLVLGLNSFIGYHGNVNWGEWMAMAALVALPMIGLYFFGQKYISQAFILSGVKG
jgi:multiple sugar transport system permease protein